MQEASPAAYAWLMKEPKEHWARYLFDKSSASADNSTKFVESFNKVINTLREKPILNLLEGIWKQVMTWIATRKGEGELGREGRTNSEAEAGKDKKGSLDF